MAKYPMDITVICSIGLEGDLIRYKDSLPYFSEKDLDFVHEWNRALKATINQPEFKQYVNTAYRMMLNLSPETLSRIIDKTAVPYRSYHYAKRFLDSMNFVSKHVTNMLSEDPYQICNIVDFGRGLSPWGCIVRYKNQNIKMYTFDNEETNEVFKSVSKKMYIRPPYFNTMPSKIVFDRDIFVSLGTFVYLSQDEQESKLKQVSHQFKNLFIELDKPNANQQDKQIVNKLGAQYNSGFSKTKIKKIIGNRIPFELEEFCGKNKDAKLEKFLQNVTEMHLIR